MPRPPRTWTCRWSWPGCQPAGAGAGPRCCWTPSTWAASATSRSGPSPAASSSGWRWRSPWPTTRPCCWPTSRPASSTGPMCAGSSSCSRRPATTSGPPWSCHPRRRGGRGHGPDRDHPRRPDQRRGPRRGRVRGRRAHRLPPPPGPRPRRPPPRGPGRGRGRRRPGRAQADRRPGRPGSRGEANMTSLVAEGLVARRGGRNVVDGVSLEVDDGQVVGLVGPSGSGKSTTLLLLAGLEPPDAGVVRLDGQDLATLGAAGRQALRRDRVALVFQGYGLLSLLTARENVELPFRVARRDPAAAATAATRWLGLLGLGDRADQRTDQLSGGERQRVALARALAVEPALLLVDEPTAELDEENRDRAVGLLRDAADRGAAVVVATHDPEVVELCDRVVRLVDGRPLELTTGPAGAGAPDSGG